MVRGAYVDPAAGKITFAAFADRWLAAQTFDESTREATEIRLRLHATPVLGRRELRDIRPSVIQAWLRGLQEQVAPRYLRTIFMNVSAVLGAAVDDELIARNPCRAKSIRLPRYHAAKVEPWPPERVAAVVDALPRRYRAVAVLAAGCGLRQGEAFGVRVCDIDFLGKRVHVEQQVKLVRARLTVAKPKGAKTRVVPLPDSVAVELAEHLRLYPAAGEELVFTSREHKPLNRTYFNSYIWRPALTNAGVEPGRANGMHALRHFYASVLIDAGESVKAVAEYLGHADPGFTLRVYAHLFPSSEIRTRNAVDRALQWAKPTVVLHQSADVGDVERGSDDLGLGTVSKAAEMRARLARLETSRPSDPSVFVHHPGCLRVE